MDILQARELCVKKAWKNYCTLFEKMIWSLPPLHWGEEAYFIDQNQKIFFPICEG